MDGFCRIGRIGCGLAFSRQASIPREWREGKENHDVHRQKGLVLELRARASPAAGKKSSFGLLRPSMQSNPSFYSTIPCCTALAVRFANRPPDSSSRHKTVQYSTWNELSDLSPHAANQHVLVRASRKANHRGSVTASRIRETCTSKLRVLASRGAHSPLPSEKDPLDSTRLGSSRDSDCGERQTRIWALSALIIYSTVQYHPPI